MAPPPGSTPIKNPKKDPLATDAQQARQSAHVGSSPFREVLKISLFSGASRFSRTSEIPKSPMATTTKSKPSCNREMPNVNRVTPSTGSSPTEPSKSPIPIMAIPFTVDSPER